MNGTYKRMFDVASALYIADSYGQSLNRIGLQKFIYLVDVVGFLYSIYPPADAHRTYFNGPYDPSIQNAADALAFRGLVEVSITKMKEDKKFYSKYKINKIGKSWISTITEDKFFEARHTVAIETGKHVNFLGWHRLVSLVYCEPTFRFNRSKGYGRRLEPYKGLENTSARIMNLIDDVLSYGSREKLPDRDFVVNLYFRYLDEFSKKHIQQNSERGD